MKKACSTCIDKGHCSVERLLKYPDNWLTFCSDYRPSPSAIEQGKKQGCDMCEFEDNDVLDMPCIACLPEDLRWEPKPAPAEPKEGEAWLRVEVNENGIDIYDKEGQWAFMGKNLINPADLRTDLIDPTGPARNDFRAIAFSLFRICRQLEAENAQLRAVKDAAEEYRNADEVYKMIYESRWNDVIEVDIETHRSNLILCKSKLFTAVDEAGL